MIVLQQTFGLICQCHTACFQDIAIVGDTKGFIGILLDQQRRNTFTINIFNNLEDLFDEFGGKP